MTVDDTVLDRLDRLEEAEATRNLLHAYAAALDAPVPEDVAALFDLDGELCVPAGTWSGRAAVADFYRDRLAADPSEKRHFIAAPAIHRLAPGLVTVRAHFWFTARAEVRSVLGWGLYSDRVRVADGVALFERKEIALHVGTDLAAGWASGSAR